MFNVKDNTLACSSRQGSEPCATGRDIGDPRSVHSPAGIGAMEHFSEIVGKLQQWRTKQGFGAFNEQDKVAQKVEELTLRTQLNVR